MIHHLLHLVKQTNQKGENPLRHYSKSDTLPISCLRSVILRSEATKNPVPSKQVTCRAKNETLRFAQGDIGKCDFCLNAL
jgi:hypothetical protein